MTLFTEANIFDVPQDVFSELPMAAWTDLTRSFTKYEIDDVKSMGPLKALGPDGFEALFYQKNWDNVAPSVNKMVLPILEGKGFREHLNETNIVLILKVDKPKLLSQFRPTGLCNIAYKIVTKALVNRIKPHLPLLISNTQASFVPGR